MDNTRLLNAYSGINLQRIMAFLIPALLLVHMPVVFGIVPTSLLSLAIPLLVLLWIIFVVCMVTSLLQTISVLQDEGAFFAPQWFCQNGTPIETKVFKMETGSGWIFSGTRNSFSVSHSEAIEKIYVVGIHPTTGKEQEFIGLCKRQDRNRFREGDRLIVYVHPQRPAAYWIQLDQHQTQYQQQHTQY